MLQPLYHWRAQCSPQQLALFETALALVCSHAISQKTLHQRYGGRYHCALISQTTLLAAIQTYAQHDNPERKKRDTTGEQFARILANQNGSMPSGDVSAEYQDACKLLKSRGIVFEHDGYDCLPAELALMLNTTKARNDWFPLCSKLPNKLLQQLVPDDMERIITGKPLHNEMMVWLACKGVQGRRQTSFQNILTTADWDLLCYLKAHGAINSVKELQRFCADTIAAEQAHARLISTCQTDRPKTKSVLESTLEEHFPERLKKLVYLGLIGILTCNYNKSDTFILLSSEGNLCLAPFWKEALHRMADQTQKSWMVADCKIGQASPWQQDHDLWRIWVTLHFMPLQKTRQKRLRKFDARKIVKLLHFEDDGILESSVACLLQSGFLTETITGIRPAKINWSKWRKQQRQAMLAGYWGRPKDHRIAAQLLCELPVEQWLDLEKVILWLQARSKQTIPSFPWESYFYQKGGRLYHSSSREHHIYLLPAFHAVLNGDPYVFPSPGWKGAQKSASISGHITAAGDIQLSPEFCHPLLKKLATFCSLSGVEHMIELRLDNNRLSAMKTNKRKLTACKHMLESLQSPLPQALTYQFEKLL